MRVEVLEHGEVGFLYRPRVETPVAQAIEDVQRFWIVLAPAGRPWVRRIAVGRKHLPDVERRQRFWAYVDRLARGPEALTRDIGREAYWTKTRGLRHQPAARVAGAGAYALARHGEHVHLAYALDPRSRDPMREELGIGAEGSYVVAVFKRALPDALAARAAERRFAPADPELLDVPGAELVLIGAAGDVKAELGIELEPAAESTTLEDVFEDLRRQRAAEAPLPLFDADGRR